MSRADRSRSQAACPSIASLAGTDERPSLVVGDLTFISLTPLLEPLLALATPDADLVLLVKPQFEVGRTGVKEGIVRDAILRADAVAGVLWAAHDLGLRTAGLIESPIAGGSGNHEYLVMFSRTAGEHPTEWLDRVSELTGAARG